MSESTAQQQQQHPIGVYIKVWILLFVLSSFSYLVDFFQLQGYLRWTLILIFMVLKAGFIISIFMHLRWERSALQYLVLLPPVAILLLVGMMAIEADYVNALREIFFSEGEPLSPYEQLPYEH
ncbi:MAG: cytochrome C oxidase subunit IV [Alteromonadaceae bacterium]|nr:MAG: cytochrome C oxidase subunit IV [Alteromonadaceae bacterium]